MGDDALEKSGAEIMARIMVGFAFVGMFLGLLALVIAAAPNPTPRQPDTITASDLRFAVDRCTPYDATFEQELACFQAVYGRK